MEHNDNSTGSETAPASSAADAAGAPPLLLLDVDGVLNAFPGRDIRSSYTRHTIDGYPIHFHRELPQMVAELRRHFDIIWFTLWNSRAAPMIGPHVGLADAPFLQTSWERGADILLGQGVSAEEVRLFMFAKTPLLPEMLGPRRRWVWIDDAHSDWDWAYLQAQGFDADNFRLVRTAAEAGLTWAEVGQSFEAAREWADQANAAAPDRADPDRAIVGAVWQPVGTAGAAVAPGSVAGRADAVP